MYSSVCVSQALLAKEQLASSCLSWLPTNDAVFALDASVVLKWTCTLLTSLTDLSHSHRTLTLLKFVTELGLLKTMNGQFHLE